MKHVNTNIIDNQLYVIDRGAYNEQRYYDAARYILMNRNKTYNELLEGLKLYSISSKERLNIVIEEMKKNTLNLGEAIEIVINYQYNLKNNIIDKEIETKFNRLGELKEEKYKPEKIVPSKLAYEFDIKDGASRDEEINLAIEFSNMLMQGYSREEISEKYNLATSTIDNYINKYLPKAPEKFVEYKLYGSNIKPIYSSEVKQYKEVLEYFIRNLDITLKKMEERKNMLSNKSEINREISKTRALKLSYERCLEVLNNERLLKSYQMNIDEEYIKEYCDNYTAAIKFLRRLKSINVADSTQEEIFEEYKKKIYINK